MGPKIKEMNNFQKLVEKKCSIFHKIWLPRIWFWYGWTYLSLSYPSVPPLCFDEASIERFFFFWLEPVASFLFGTDLFPQAPGGMRCFWFFTCLSDPRVAVARLFLLILSSSLCRPGWITPLLLPTSGPPLISVMHAGDQNRTRDQLRGK